MIFRDARDKCQRSFFLFNAMQLKMLRGYSESSLEANQELGIFIGKMYSRKV